MLPEAPDQDQVRVLLPPMAPRSSAAAIAAAGTEGALAPERVMPLLLMASTKTAVSGSSSSTRPAERTAAAMAHAIGATSVVAAALATVIPSSARTAIAAALHVNHREKRFELRSMAEDHRVMKQRQPYAGQASCAEETTGSRQSFFPREKEDGRTVLHRSL